MQALALVMISAAVAGEADFVDVCDSEIESCDVPVACEPPSANASFWPDPPFNAWVATSAVNVRLHPDRYARVIGLLREGDMVEVTQCVPSCDVESAWGLLAGRGAVSLDALRARVPDELLRATGTPYTHAVATVSQLRVRGAPRANARTLKVFRRGTVLALVDGGSPAKPGWFRHLSGGWVRASQVRVLRPSAFEGVRDPEGVIAFIKRPTIVDGSGRTLDRHARVRALSLTGSRVRVEGGTIRRGDVALAFPRARPLGIEPGSRWIHVDVNEQVLTAYESDRLVYATLISSGRGRTPTRTGVFRMWAKIAHADMRGGGRRPYVVEEVPHVMSFNGEQALHAALWHNQFGSPVSHGCVNLSPKDAAWIFTWSPPELPSGWRAVITKHAGLGQLYIVVERAPPGRFDEPVHARMLLSSKEQ